MERAGCAYRVSWHKPVNAPQYQRLTSIEAPYCPDVFMAARYGLGLREFHGSSDRDKVCMHFLGLVANLFEPSLSNHCRRSPVYRPGWLNDCIAANTVQLSCTSDQPRPLQSGRSAAELAASELPDGNSLLASTSGCLIESLRQTQLVEAKTQRLTESGPSCPQPGGSSSGLLVSASCRTSGPAASSPTKRKCGFRGPAVGAPRRTALAR